MEFWPLERAQSRQKPRQNDIVIVPERRSYTVILLQTRSFSCGSWVDLVGKRSFGKGPLLWSQGIEALMNLVLKKRSWNKKPRMEITWFEWGNTLQRILASKVSIWSARAFIHTRGISGRKRAWRSRKIYHLNMQVLLPHQAGIWWTKYHSFDHSV